MRGHTEPNPMEFNGHCFSDSVLTCLSGRGEERWSIDLPAVLWFLERIDAGDVEARTVARALRQAVRRESGCCSDCDLAMPYFDEARRRHEENVQAWERQQEQIDLEKFPYILNKGKIHTVSCRYPPQPSLEKLPGGLHEFSGLFRACNHKLDAVFAELDRRSSSRAQRINEVYVQDYIARHGVAAMKAKLCRSCKPALPAAGPAEEALRPACWSWSLESAKVEELWAVAAQSPNTRVNVLEEHRVAYTVLELWQGSRCAVCAVVKGPLVRDHDRSSGLIRGLLCNPCNTAEGRSTSELFDNYRVRPPAGMLEVEILYLPGNFKPGSGHMPSSTG
ncbi:endonuclease domain-containing protein [Actinomadura luteofluorescens]|uniref:endonuclease domain-containing protein n=1 Tax=Actinomadura luteofluorescens TaxID=46163 RepID=UPI0030D436B3